MLNEWKVKGPPHPKKKFLMGIHNRRPMGKPRTRREDVITKDTSQILGI